MKNEDGCSTQPTLNDQMGEGDLLIIRLHNNTFTQLLNNNLVF